MPGTWVELLTFRGRRRQRRLLHAIPKKKGWGYIMLHSPGFGGTLHEGHESFLHFYQILLTFDNFLLCPTTPTNFCEHRKRGRRIGMFTLILIVVDIANPTV